MKIFISWSGGVSGGVACFLKRWLKEIFPDVKSFVSLEDIPPGAPWQECVDEALAASDFGIACVTAENLDSYYMGYEWRALLEKGARFCPLIVDPVLRRRQVRAPLSSIQASSATNFGDVLRLLVAINELRDTKACPSADELETILKRKWDELQAALPPPPPPPVDYLKVIDDFGAMVALIKAHQQNIPNRLSRVIRTVVSEYARDTSAPEEKHDAFVTRAEERAAEAIRINIDEAVNESAAFRENPHSRVVGDVRKFFWKNFDREKLLWILKNEFRPILANPDASLKEKIEEMEDMMNLYVLEVFSHFHMALAAALVAVARRSVEAARVK